MDAPVQYSRWYGTDAVYTHTKTFAAGRPSFVVGSMIGSAIGYAARRNSAIAAAQRMWREHQTVRTLITNRRIMCRTVNGWLSFCYTGVVSSTPDPAASTPDPGVIRTRTAPAPRLRRPRGCACSPRRRFMAAPRSATTLGCGPSPSSWPRGSPKSRKRGGFGG